MARERYSPRPSKPRIDGLVDAVDDARQNDRRGVARADHDLRRRFIGAFDRSRRPTLRPQTDLSGAIYYRPEHLECIMRRAGATGVKLRSLPVHSLGATRTRHRRHRSHADDPTAEVALTREPGGVIRSQDQSD